MVRYKSDIALGAHDDRPDYDYADGCELRVYDIHDGVKIDAEVYGMNNTVELSASVKRQGHSILVTVEAGRPYTIRMVNMRAAEAKNGFLTLEGNDSIVTPDQGANVIEITF